MGTFCMGVLFFGYPDFTFLSFGASLALFSASFSLNCSEKIGNLGLYIVILEG